MVTSGLEKIEYKLKALRRDVRYPGDSFVGEKKTDKKRNESEK